MSSSVTTPPTAGEAAPSPAVEAPPIVRVSELTKAYALPDGKLLKVLEGIDLEVRSGEFVALLGRSGSGKSTLLRCIAGLIAPSDGEVLFDGVRVTGCNRGTAMVFQTFALLPWLTVQQNVELGLEARGIPPAARTARALRAIDTVGLDGYESAFPKELSGGMRQRVGFARALVVEPEVLLMDEPFSALDVLTAENLRGELLELWEGKRFPTKSIVMVTHNIEEAVLLADRILVLGSNPGRIHAEIVNPLERPRKRRTPRFDELVDRLYGIMTDRPEPADGGAPTRALRGTPGDTPLPHATVDGLSGLTEILHNRGDGAADLADLAETLSLEVDDLLPLVDALVLLGFAALDEDNLRLTTAGDVFAGADIQESKRIFARAVLERAPLVRTIASALRGCSDGNLPSGFFEDILQRSFGEEAATAQLHVAINWGRYAELYAFDASRNVILREDQTIPLLEEEEEREVGRGSLRVYLGAAPGAGKTFAMLREGQARRAQGEDVVIAAVDARGRPHTVAAIDGLERVPPLMVEVDGGAREEIDVPAVLARRPQTALVDDLEHGWVSGDTSHPRYQDVETIRAAGINVITTLDVQSAGSVRDLIAEVVEAPAETAVPESVLAGADEIQLVDISPVALRKRLRHGNIYPAGQVEPALRGTFDMARLAALREIALQFVSARVHPEPAAGGPAHDVLVAVSALPSGEHLIGRGSRLARRAGGAARYWRSRRPAPMPTPIRGCDAWATSPRSPGRGSSPAPATTRAGSSRRSPASWWSAIWCWGCPPPPAGPGGSAGRPWSTACSGPSLTSTSTSWPAPPRPSPPPPGPSMVAGVATGPPPGRGVPALRPAGQRVSPAPRRRRLHRRPPPGGRSASTSATPAAVGRPRRCSTRPTGGHRAARMWWSRRWRPTAGPPSRAISRAWRSWRPARVPRRGGSSMPMRRSPGDPRSSASTT